MSSDTSQETSKLDDCCDVVTDAVPNQQKINGNNEKMNMPSARARPNEEKTRVREHEPCLKSCCEHKCCNKPSERTRPKPANPSTSPRRPRNHPQAMPNATTYINISNTSHVQIGNKYTIKMAPVDKTTKNHSSPMKETKEIKKLLQSNEPATVDDISVVSTHVGTSWKEMGRLLHYTDGQLEQFDADHGKGGLKEVVYQLLLDWKQVNSKKATVGTLCSALKNSNQQDAVIEWSKVRL